MSVDDYSIAVLISYLDLRTKQTNNRRRLQLL
jgi:hypothetical protein